MRITVDADDSTGKHKAGAAKARGAMLTAALLVGMCLGVMVSEKLYLVSQEAELAPEAVAAARSRKLELSSGAATGGGGAVVRRAQGKPRNALEELLQRVAPQGEVMIAIRWVPGRRIGQVGAGLEARSGKHGSGRRMARRPQRLCYRGRH